jgi:succinate-semialdehyde dehydrogenase/glutarate-semialdehyde dehydrogenase
MTLYAEETFGPVVSLYRFTRVDEAIGRANDSSYGLNASVWSKNTRAALEVGKRLQAGTVNINEAYASTWTSTASPIGGMKQSGFGRRHGEEGILKYTEAQTIAVQRWLPIATPWFLSEQLYAKFMPRLVRMLRHLPGLR